MLSSSWQLTIHFIFKLIKIDLRLLFECYLSNDNTQTSSSSWSITPAFTLRFELSRHGKCSSNRIIRQDGSSQETCIPCLPDILAKHDRVALMTYRSFLTYNTIGGRCGWSRARCHRRVNSSGLNQVGRHQLNSADAVAMGWHNTHARGQGWITPSIRSILAGCIAFPPAA